MQQFIRERTEYSDLCGMYRFLYGMMAKSFVDYAKTSYGVHITEEQAVLIRTRFFNLYPELSLYYQRVEAEMTNSFYQTSIMGREYRFNPSVVYSGNVFFKYLRAAINFPVQSAGSDYVVSGIIEVMTDSSLQQNIKGCATVHDSIIFLVRKNSHFKETILRVQSIMEKPRLAKVLLTKERDIPIVVDIEIGPLGKGVGLDEYLKEATWIQELDS